MIRLEVAVSTDPGASRGGEVSPAIALGSAQEAVDRPAQKINPLSLAGRDRYLQSVGHGEHCAHDLQEELALGPEIVVNESARDPGRPGNVGGGDHVVVALGEQVGGDPQDLGAARVASEICPALLRFRAHGQCQASMEIGSKPKSWRAANNWYRYGQSPAARATLPSLALEDSSRR
jgi:hypothetical protein